jgi:nucleotide-binding universal stress UspA family protein
VFKTIVVGVDGSPGGDRAFELARGVAAEQSARIVVVHVTELVGGKGGVYPLAADDDEIKARLDSEVRALRADGQDVELVAQSVRFGGPAHVIADIAESADADLIVVGTRGRASISELVLGSVPVRLLQIAHRPLLVAPPQDARK